MIRILLGALALVLPGQALGQHDAAADSSRRFFYFTDPLVGHTAYSGPLDVVVNRGYSIITTGNRSRDVFRTRHGWSSVRQTFADPNEAVQRLGGWWEVIRTEILPLTPDISEGRWYANYTGHVIEGAVHTRRLQEWFEYHGVWGAPLWAGVLSGSAAVLNEMYETGSSRRGSAAVLMDLAIFDPLGIALSYSDRFNEWLAAVGTTLWPGQVSITLPDYQLHNNAARLTFKFPWTFDENERWSPFFWTGLGAQAGATFHRADGLDISAGVGVDSRTMHVDPVTNAESITVLMSAGVFFDRDGVLLGSAYVSGVHDRLLSLNVYPGVLGGRNNPLGFWLVVERNGTVRVGLTSRDFLGLGVGIAH